MIRHATTLAAAVAAFFFAAAAVAQPQCPESNVTVQIVADDTPGCATIAPADGKAELNITNSCGEDQFHIEGGADCPNCGPPVTLRMGTFGAFIVNTQPVSAFTPESSPTDHVLTWARADTTGAMTVRVVPNITLCPLPDMGSMVDMAVEEPTVPEPEGDKGGCSTAQSGGFSLWGFALFAFVRRRRATRKSRTKAR